MNSQPIVFFRSYLDQIQMSSLRFRQFGLCRRFWITVLFSCQSHSTSGRCIRSLYILSIQIGFFPESTQEEFISAGGLSPLLKLLLSSNPGLQIRVLTCLGNLITNRRYHLLGDESFSPLALCFVFLF